MQSHRPMIRVQVYLGELCAAGISTRCWQNCACVCSRILEKASEENERPQNFATNFEKLRFTFLRTLSSPPPHHHHRHLPSHPSYHPLPSCCRLPLSFWHFPPRLTLSIFLAKASASALSSVMIMLSKIVPALTCHRSKPRKPKSAYL